LSDSTTLVRVLALGDVMLAPYANDAADAHCQLAQLRSLRSQLDRSDVVFANLETTLPGQEGPIPKQPRLITDPDLMNAALDAMHINVVSLANNHAFDCHTSGFVAVEDLLNQLQIRCFGAGSTEHRARQSIVTETRGMRIGWLGFVTDDTHPSHKAGATSPGPNLFQPESACRDIATLRAEVDHVLVSIHWGHEYCHIPSPAQVSAARSMIDAGASVVLGHHAHVIQGIERHRHGVIAYGLGNVVTFDLAIDGRLAIKQSRRTRSGVALQLTLHGDGHIDYDPIPFRMVEREARLHDRYAARLLLRASEATRRGITPNYWRRQRIIEDLVCRPLWKLDPRVIRSVKFGHIRKFVTALRSLGSEKQRYQPR